MATAIIQHTYDCDEDTFWSDIVFDKSFNEKLFLGHLGFKQWEIAKLEENDDKLEREVVIRPVTGDLPKALSKLVGDNLGFREQGTFDKKAKRYRFRIIPNRLADKLRISGEIYVEARGEGRCERFVRLEVEAKIFGVGGMVEKQIIGDTKTSYEKGFAFGRDYLRNR